MNRLSRIRNWFRTKRSLVGQLDDFEAIVAKQIDEIQELREEMKSGFARAIRERSTLQQSLRHAQRAVDTQRVRTNDAEDKLARVVEELKALHAEIRRAELADAVADETEMKRRLDV